MQDEREGARRQRHSKALTEAVARLSLSGETPGHEGQRQTPGVQLSVALDCRSQLTLWLSVN